MPLQQAAIRQPSVTEIKGEQVFTDLLVPLIQPGYRLACAMLHDPQAAEDAVQEASLIAWRKLKSLADMDHLRPWFLAIVANECRNVRRRRWWHVVNFGLAPAVGVASGEERSVLRADLRKALSRLQHEDRLVVSLYFYLDMPMTEVAAVAGSSVEATRQRLYRAVRRLRPDLEVEEALR
jgi:RNA polymerase sigma-70 factor (ECF subfamily)